MLSSRIEEFCEMRSNWHILKNDATKLSEEWKIHLSFTNVRGRREPKIFGELYSDGRLEVSEKRSRTEVAYRNLDIFTAQLKIRCNMLEQISKTFKCWSPPFLLETSDQDIANAKALTDAYPEDISLNLAAHIQWLKTYFSISNRFKRVISIQELTKFLLINFQPNSLPDVKT